VLAEAGAAVVLEDTELTPQGFALRLGAALADLIEALERRDAAVAAAPVGDVS
jgi:hypothetical protein